MNNKKPIRRICLLSLIILGLFIFITPQNAMSARLAGEEDTITTSGKKPLTTQPAKVDDAKKPALPKPATTTAQPVIAPGMPLPEDEPASAQPVKAGEPVKTQPLAKPPSQLPPQPPVVTKPSVRPAKVDDAKKPALPKPATTTAQPVIAPGMPTSEDEDAPSKPVPVTATPASVQPAKAGEPAKPPPLARPPIQPPPPPPLMGKSPVEPAKTESAKKPTATTPPPAAAPVMPTPAPAAPLPVQPVKAGETPPPAAKPPVKDTRYVTIDFDNVDIQVFVKFISELTGKNFVIDDKVKGKVTVISPRKIAVDDVYKVFQSVLDIHGFATVEAGEVIKIVPTQVAKEKSLETRTDEDVISPEDRMVTQIISLDHASPDEMKKVLEPLISKTSVILSYPPTGMLIIADMLSNVKRLQDIIAALDVQGVAELISYVPLKYASATEMLKSLTVLFQQQAGRAGIAPIRVVADDRANALIISATENDTERVRGLISLMDKEIPKGTGLIRVYYLQNAKAEDTAKVLTSLQQQTKTPDGKPAAVSKSVQIVADKATNSLIITADTSDYLIIEDVIKKLDISRPMVYLEALIMEVNANKNFKLGVEWKGGNTVTYDGKTGAYVGGFSGEGEYKITSGLGATASMPAGLTLGVIGQAITVGSITFPNLAAFIQAYQGDTDVRILSTPQVLTLDNEEAEITVGKNVPYVTRQDTTATSTINYSSYEYKDVGITLKVTPQINKEGFVRMKIDQSVTKLDAQTQDVGLGQKILAPTTLKRTAKTTVTVKSGDTIVIGGLIDDYFSEGVYKVPLLGDIPLLGWLFKYKSRVGEKTNLFVFITPRIIQKPEDARSIHEDKKEYMRSIQEGTVKSGPARKKEAKAQK